MNLNTIEQLSNLPASLPNWLITILIVLVLIVTILLILAAFAVKRGQEVSFWPPKIGAISQPSNFFEHSSIKPSNKTPDSELLTHIINSTIETVCRAVSLPGTPDEASIRAFIFQKIDNKLVCTHFWAQNPVVEEVGMTMFDLTDVAAKDVAVVRAFKERKPIRTPIEPHPHGLHGNIDQNISYVLATPILNEDKTVWGCVDFDASNKTGVVLLSSSISDTVMLNLARLLSFVLKSYKSKNKLT